MWLVGKTEDDFTKADMLLEHSADFFKGRFNPNMRTGGGLRLKMILLMLLEHSANFLNGRVNPNKKKGGKGGG